MAAARHQFQGKTILITGGTGDIGRASAHRFALDGARVIILDINEERLHETIEELKVYDVQTAAYLCDVTDNAEVRQVIDRAVTQFERIDYLFNNAGYQGAFAKADEYPEDDFKMVIDVNVIGVYNMLKVVGKHMRQMGGGAIVNTASMAGVAGPPNMLAYSASKAAVIGMTKTASKDFAPYNVRINAISPALIGPGYMWTRQTELQAESDSQYFDSDPEVVEKQMLFSVPMRRLGSLEEVANGVAFLASDEASYITGFNLEVSGG